jgi:YVTN family beta-propeller protein
MLLASLYTTLVLLMAPPEPNVGTTRDGGQLLSTYQKIRPAGESVEFRGRPIDLCLSPTGRWLFAKDNRGILVLDTVKWQIVQELSFPEGGGSLHGITVHPNGSTLFATNSESTLFEGSIDATGRVTWARKLSLTGFDKKASFPCGIALNKSGDTAYVCLSRNNTLAVVDLQQMRLLREIKTGIAPWDVLLSTDEKTAWVSNWGGRHPKKEEKTALSAGTAVPVDERGVAVSGSVSLLNLETHQETVQIETGLHASDLLLSSDGRTLYVANANADTVTIIDTTTKRVRETLNTAPDLSLPYGSAPNALTLSDDQKTLFVANGGNNALALFDLTDARKGRRKLRGFVPTGWYPGALAHDASYLYVANVKGLGSRGEPQKDQKGRNAYDYLGTISRIPYPTPETLKRYTAQVLADGRVPQILRARERSESNVPPVPVPQNVGEPSVFEHIVYIIKENRTYDQVFGDLKQGNGDPTLCLYPRLVTPNHHALVEQFVLLDNFYCNGILSADGHSWATEGNNTDHLEKAFGGFTRSYTFGDDPLTYSSTGFIWDNVLQKGLTFRNYGEMVYSEPMPGADFKAIYQDHITGTKRLRYPHIINIERLARYTHPTYPGWNMNIPDLIRADLFLKELAQFEKEDNLPNFTILYLPSDHTSGTSPNTPTPRAQVADNDLALGRVVEGLSKSKFWAKTCIFVVEDDPQDGFDHVDGHRSPCLVISPYTKRGKVVPQFYNQTSVLHTIQRILGLPPMNQLDAMAPLMTACFTTKPDMRPYTALPNRVPLDEMNPPLTALRGKKLYWAKKSMNLPKERPDEAEEDTFNRILWHAAKGVNTPYPAHLVGSREERKEKKSRGKR